MNLMQTICSLLSDGLIVGLAMRYLSSVLSKSAFVNSCIDIIGLATLAHGQELGTLVVILLVCLPVCHHGKSLSGHQT